MCQRKFNDLVCHLSSTLQSILTLNTKESSPCVLFTWKFVSSISSVNVKGNDASNKRQHEGRRHVKLVATIFDGAVNQKLRVVFKFLDALASLRSTWSVCQSTFWEFVFDDRIQHCADIVATLNQHGDH